jgi:hypothetical protein
LTKSDENPRRISEKSIEISESDLIWWGFSTDFSVLEFLRIFGVIAKKWEHEYSVSCGFNGTVRAPFSLQREWFQVKVNQHGCRKT